jgi:hypothetical protein
VHILFLPAPPTRLALPPYRPPLDAPRFGEIGYGYRPQRSFGYSLMFHVCALFLLAFAARLAALRPNVVVVKPQLEAAQRSRLLLPFLGGGHEGQGHRGGSSGKTRKDAAGGLRAQSRRGFAYPGPQAIISNPPHAVLGTQTILQQMKNLPHLRHEIPLPNLVRPASAEAPDHKPTLKIKSGSLVFHHKRQKSIKAPKLKLHVKDSKALSALAELRPVMPTKAVPDAVDPSALKSGDRKQKGLLVLNAIAPPPDVSGKVPLAEKRSLFAVTPSEVTTIADPGAGTKAGGQDSAAVGNGNRPDVARGDALAELMPADAMQNNLHSSGSGSGSGSGVGNGSGNGLSSQSRAAAMASATVVR